MSASHQSIQQLAVERREQQKLSYKEIAARLGVPVGTIKSRIARWRHARGIHLRPRKESESSHV